MHPTDGELLANLDQWTDPTGPPHLERHLKSCDLCRKRQAALERERLTVGALLGALESPAPARAVESIVERARRRRRNRRRQLVAAVASLFVATAAAAAIRTGGVHEILPRGLARAIILVAGRVVFLKKGSGIITEARRVGNGFRIPLVAPGPTR